MFFVYRFVITWAIWFLFADKKRWRELLLVAIFAALIGQLSDQAFMEFYKLWDYDEPHNGNEKLNQLFTFVLDDISVYMVAVYLFLQWLPKKRTVWMMSAYWFLWSAFAIVIEWIHLKTGHMNHYQFWGLEHSFIADLLLFTMFFYFHKVFHLEKLSED